MCMYNILKGSARTISSWIMYRVGQNYTYTVYTRYSWQGLHQTYGHIWRVYTVLVSPHHARPSSVASVTERTQGVSHCRLALDKIGVGQNRIHTVYDLTFDGFPAENAVYTSYVYGSGQP